MIAEEEKEEENKNQDVSNIKYKDVNMSDNSLTYYSFYAYNKIVSKYFQNTTNNFEADEIMPGIFLGSINSSYDLDVLKSKGITHIISVILGYDPAFPEDFQYLIINALDNENNSISDVFESCNDFINDALFESNGKVLIHCMAGRSRSATILAAYIIKTYGMDVENVLNLLRKKRKIVEPNSSFVKQLNEYYKNKYINNA
jgi:protein tyrosine/serine phosphatase